MTWAPQQRRCCVMGGGVGLFDGLLLSAVSNMCEVAVYATCAACWGHVHGLCLMCLKVLDRSERSSSSSIGMASAATAVCHWFQLRTLKAGETGYWVERMLRRLGVG